MYDQYIQPLMQVGIFILGCFCLFRAVRYWIFFKSSKARLAVSMRLILTEQFVSSGVLLIFSFNSLLGTLRGEPPEEWNNISVEFAILLRLVAMSFIYKSTGHLGESIRLTLEKENNDQPDTR